MKEPSGHPAGTLRVTVGILAHDAKKDEVCLFARAQRHLLDRVCLMAPEDTAMALEEVGLEVEMLLSGSRGGDLQLGAAVVEGRVDAVIFIQDPLVPLAGEPDIGAMMKVCDLERIPIATNLATAEIVLHRLADVRRIGDPPVDDPFDAYRSGRVIRLNRPARDGSRRSRMKR